MAKKRSYHKNLIKKIAYDTELYENQVKSVIIAFIQETIRALCAGRSVQILSLGKFWVKRSRTNAWDPYRQKKIKLPLRLIPKFTYGRRVSDFIKQVSQEAFEGQED